ncbi:uncharacterized protein LOC115879063 [Sitophilus oryzae]|uniref:Uncharacterized protein LOC115879063 n=1 Tax=Sitophilus oryzae TaxID=7048 RepID=A0A6J2XKC0_SITOR|nr:uncharacterized protein LOC115879063 [Sitophilus oryzae]
MAKSKTELEDKTQHVMKLIMWKLPEMEMQVTIKTELSQQAIKYLGMYLDKDVRMTSHTKRICEKANTAINKLSRLKRNIGGLRATKRRVQTTAVLSLMLYAAPGWKSGLKFKSYRDLLERLNRRMAICIISAYRTASREAVRALAGMAPIKLLVKERDLIIKGEKVMTYAQWQTRWNEYQGWTKTFIKDIIKLCERNHCEKTQNWVI